MTGDTDRREEARGYLVHGRVQGVGFRWWTRRIADRLGVTGWVRNLPTGSVEARARGTLEALAAFEESLGKGPPMSHVSSVESWPAEDEVPVDDFHIEPR